MTSNAVVLLDELLKEREALRGGNPLPADEAFELFTFEQAVKDSELSPDEISDGQAGSGEDGGIDGAYTFLNGNLVAGDSEVREDTFDPTNVRRAPDLTFVVIQAKQTASFAEAPFEKLQATFGEVLELAKDGGTVARPVFCRARRARRDIPPSLAQALNPSPPDRGPHRVRIQGRHGQYQRQGIGQSRTNQRADHRLDTKRRRDSRVSRRS
jgi:hypothetical protein